MDIGIGIALALTFGGPDSGGTAVPATALKSEAGDPLKAEDGTILKTEQ